LENISIIQNTTTASSQDLFDTSVDLYQIALDPNNSRTYLAGLQLNATFYEGFTDKETPKSGQRAYSVTSHICKLQAGIVAYKVRLASGTVSLSSRSDDEFLELVCVSPCCCHPDKD
jgi:hypothetical protein